MSKSTKNDCVESDEKNDVDSNEKTTTSIAMKKTVVKNDERNDDVESDEESDEKTTSEAIKNDEKRLKFFVASDVVFSFFFLKKRGEATKVVFHRFRRVFSSFSSSLSISSFLTSFFSSLSTSSFFRCYRRRFFRRFRRIDVVVFWSFPSSLSTPSFFVDFDIVIFSSISKSFFVAFEVVLCRCMTARDRLRAWDVNFFWSSYLTHKSCCIFVASWGFAHCVGIRLVSHNFLSHRKEDKWKNAKNP